MIKLVTNNRIGKFMSKLKSNELNMLNSIGKFAVEKMQYYVAVDTGYLQSRCEYVINRNELWLQNDCLYAGYQEYGTSKMVAHPFFKPAIFNHLREIEEIAARSLREGID